MKTSRHFDPMGDRYRFDFRLCTAKHGWAQVDTSQDASFFGHWANPTKLQVVVYVEGDITVSKAESADEFVAYIREMKRWNDEGGHRFKGIDCMCDNGIETAFRNLGLGDLLH